jgi:6-phosphofructokinase 1
VVNASLAAVIAACQDAPAPIQLWGCRLGMHGLVHGAWKALAELSAAQVNQLRHQPGAALGSSRYRTQPGDLPALLRLLHQRQVQVLLLIGGNGTMSAAHAIHQTATDNGYTVNGAPLRVAGIPKTIDNDLAGTYTSPGYGSAARFVAETTRSIGLDLYSMMDYDQVAVLEVMGRHTGWLAAASALARTQPDDPPHLILLPEAPWDEDAFLARVLEIYQQRHLCLVVAAEGLRDVEGNYLAEKQQPAERDASGQRMLSLAAGVAPYLAQLVRSRLGLLCRQMRPDTIQRSCAALASPVDRHLAELSAHAAVIAAVDGRSDFMAGIVYDPAGWDVALTPLADVIGRERVLPAEMFDAEGFDVTSHFINYAAPLVGEGWLTPMLL